MLMVCVCNLQLLLVIDSIFGVLFRVVKPWL